MGQAHLRLNQDEDALASFDRAIACEPGFADAHGNRANVLADMGRLEEAVAAFDRALAVRPDNAEDICNRGERAGRSRPPSTRRSPATSARSR